MIELHWSVILGISGCAFLFGFVIAAMLAASGLESRREEWCSEIISEDKIEEYLPEDKL